MASPTKRDLERQLFRANAELARARRDLRIALDEMRPDLDEALAFMASFEPKPKPQLTLVRGEASDG